jgi:hypothetical protein
MEHAGPITAPTSAVEVGTSEERASGGVGTRKAFQSCRNNSVRLVRTDSLATHEQPNTYPRSSSIDSSFCLMKIARSSQRFPTMLGSWRMQIPPAGRARFALGISWSRIGRILWLVLSVGISLLGVESYAIREMLVAWLFFSVLYTAGVIVVIAAYLAGSIVDHAVLWMSAKLRRFCRTVCSMESVRSGLLGCAPAGEGKRKPRSFSMNSRAPVGMRSSEAVQDRSS